MRLALGIALSLCGSPALAECTRHTVENEGFSSLAYITTDADWHDKWMTPREVVPEISCVDSLAVGETGFLLVFFHGAGVVGDHFAVDCDVRATDPKGEVTDLPRQPCAHFILNGLPPTDVYLTIHQIGILPEPDEIGGSYHVSYGLTDGVSGKRLVHEITVPVEAAK